MVILRRRSQSQRLRVRRRCALYIIPVSCCTLSAFLCSSGQAINRTGPLWSRAFSAASGVDSSLLAGVDLAARWRELVAQGDVVASVFSQRYGKIRYGVRSSEDGGFEEFVIGSAELNSTLTAEGSQHCMYDGKFAASVHLVRTLRPPPTPGLQDIPPYDPSTDSFVTGPLRLDLRPRAATIRVSSTGRVWDCFHNISPCDINGHFLLLPTIEDRRNWRRQALTSEDCVDLIWMSRDGGDDTTTSSSWLITFNSVRAGASQNHIHCHLWSSTPLPLKAVNISYAVTSASAREDVPPVVMASGVELALLDYPCTVVRIRGGSAAAAGKALADTIAAVERTWPYNLAVLGGEAWVFVRSSSGERSPLIPMLKLGASEMCGHFHCHSEDDLRFAATPGLMAQALGSVSADALAVWHNVLAATGG